MEEKFVTYEIALAVIELGFDEPTRFGNETSLYNNKGLHVFYYNYGVMMSGCGDEYVKAPLWDQVIDWFRDEHKINIETPFLPNVNKYGIVVSDKMGPTPKHLTDVQNILRGQDITNNYVKYDDYNDAREAAILKAIGMLQERINLKKFMEFHMGDNQNEEI